MFVETRKEKEQKLETKDVKKNLAKYITQCRKAGWWQKSCWQCNFLQIKCMH